MHKKFTNAKQVVTDAEKRAKRQAKALREHKEEIVGLREKTKKLEIVESEYKAWKKREPEVRHYLQSFAAIAR
jgi:hypothetical protein